MILKWDIFEWDHVLGWLWSSNSLLTRLSGQYVWMAVSESGRMGRCDILGRQMQSAQQIIFYRFDRDLHTSLYCTGKAATNYNASTYSLVSVKYIPQVYNTIHTSEFSDKRTAWNIFNVKLYTIALWSSDWRIDDFHPIAWKGAMILHISI